MYCPHCEELVPDDARVCGFCGNQLRAVPRRPIRQQAAPAQPAPIIVHTSGSGGFLSGCSGVLNLVLSLLVIGLIGAFVLVFLCVIRLPEDFPVIDPPKPVAAMWSRVVDWQEQNCSGQFDDQGENGEQPTGNACTRSKFVSETIKDNTDFAHGEAFKKTWTVRNDGSCTWTTDYVFRFTQGERMGGPQSIKLDHEVKPGETYTFELDLVAPDKPGTYSGRWEIFDENGNSFGWYSVVIDVVVPGQKPAVKDATLFVEPSAGDKCSIFTITFSGYGPNEEIAIEFSYFTDPAVLTGYSKIRTDGSGEAVLTWFADVSIGGQYIVWGRSPSAVGSAVFIIEADDACTCDGVCPVSACSQADTEEECVAAGGTWQLVRADPGPNFFICACHGENPFE